MHESFNIDVVSNYSSMETSLDTVDLNRECIVCLGEISDTDDIITCHRCEIESHQECYNRWNNGCPNCRLDFKPKPKTIINNNEHDIPCVICQYVFAGGCILYLVVSLILILYTFYSFVNRYNTYTNNITNNI